MWNKVKTHWQNFQYWLLDDDFPGDYLDEGWNEWPVTPATPFPKRDDGHSFVWTSSVAMKSLDEKRGKPQPLHRQDLRAS